MSGQWTGENSRLTEAEKEAMQLSCDLWDKVVSIGFQHPDDLNDVHRNIHAIQNIILAQPEQTQRK